jgi:diguanylate cyclase (GGDEF)-like protein
VVKRTLHDVDVAEGLRSWWTRRVHGPTHLDAPEYAPDLKAMSLDRAAASVSDRIDDDIVSDPADAPDDVVSDRVLSTVITNMLPTPALVTGFTVIVLLVLRDDLEPSRAAWWSAISFLASAMSVLAIWLHQRRSDGTIPGWQVWNLRVAFGLLGLTFGLAPWATGGDSVEPTLMFTLFPAVAGAVVAIVTAGRRDLYLWFLIPTMSVSAASLALSGVERLQALSLVVVFYAFALLVMHQVVSVSATRAIRLQWRSDELLARQHDDRTALRVKNTELQDVNQRLHHQARHDPLTGLLNRRGTIEELEQLLELAGPSQPLSVLFCDLDLFRQINQTLGHRGGDEFLTAVADRIERSVGSAGIAGRLGGDEFVIILPSVDPGGAIAVANRVVVSVAQPVLIGERAVPSSVSVGVATAPTHGNTSSDLLRNANAALYRAKAAGRNRVEIFDGTMQRQIDVRVASEEKLRRALDRGDILPFFQPEVDAATGNVVGAELLARWVHDDGTVSPAMDFLDTAANAGLLDRITEAVLVGARSQMRRLALLGLPDGFRFRINVAPDGNDRNWRHSRLDELIEGLDPAMLTIDIHESSVASDMKGASDVLRSFRARGGRVCLDDFARGVSSLSLLRQLSLDEVRIDRLAIDTITAHPHDRIIVRSVIALVRELRLAITADGVETGPQADALIALGCVRHQGNYYAPALPPDEFEQFVLERMAETYQREARGVNWPVDEFG